MNAKDAVRFIERKFDNRIKNVKREYEECIRNEKDVVDKVVIEIGEKISKEYLKQLASAGLPQLEAGDIDVNINRWTSKRYDNTDIPRLRKERDDKIEKIREEQEEFTDKVLILGVKNPEVKAKLEELIK